LAGNRSVEVSIVIPAHNEAIRIAGTIRRLFGELSVPFEVVVSEDGSSDGTNAVVDRLAQEYKGRMVVLHSERRLGKGRGFLRGVEHSRGKYIVLLDADFPSNADSIERIIESLRQGYDLVLGSRAHALSVLDPPAPPIRQALGRVFNSIVRVVFHLGVHDTQCGVKGFRREVFRVLGAIQFTSFVFDVEVTVKASVCNLRILEVPIYWSSKGGSKVRVLRDSLLMLNGLANIWLRLPGYRQRVEKIRIEAS